MVSIKRLFPGQNYRDRDSNPSELESNPPIPPKSPVPPPKDPMENENAGYAPPNYPPTTSQGALSPQHSGMINNDGSMGPNYGTSGFGNNSPNNPQYESVYAPPPPPSPHRNAQYESVYGGAAGGTAGNYSSYGNAQSGPVNDFHAGGVGPGAGAVPSEKPRHAQGPHYGNASPYENYTAAAPAPESANYSSYGNTAAGPANDFPAGGVGTAPSRKLSKRERKERKRAEKEARRAEREKEKYGRGARDSGYYGDQAPMVAAAGVGPATTGYNEKHDQSGTFAPTGPPVAVSQLSRYPSNIACPYCNQVTATTVHYESGTTTHLMAALVCWFTCLGCIPYFIRGIKDVRHDCGNCGGTVAVVKRAGGIEWFEGGKWWAARR